MFWIKCLLLSILGGLISWIYATRGRKNHPLWGTLRQFRYAHRGLHDKAHGIPENSMAAFRRASERGFGIELDVHLTRDGQLAVIHDKSLLRTAGVDIDISSLSAEEVKQYHLEGTQETIPLLEEVLPLFQGGPPLLVELKADYWDVHRLVEQAVQTLDRYGVTYCIESFHPGVIYWLMRYRPEVCRGQLSQDFCRKPSGLTWWQALCMTGLLSNFFTCPDFISFHYRHRLLPSVWFCKYLHRLKLFCWTVQSQRELDQLEREGCLIIFEGFVPERSQDVTRQAS